jgi:NAD(P)-dependent dehydrogenase (short-subunit alcohol dehydrogenase family)
MAGGAGAGWSISGATGQRVLCEAALTGCSAMESGVAGRLDGKSILVTGAAKGIGAAIAMLFAREGGRIAVTDIDAAGAEATAAAIRAQGWIACGFAHDVVREADWDRVVASAQAAHGVLDVLVNNAGIALLKPISEMTLEEFRRQNEVNLHGVFLGLKAGAASMRARGGSIINMSSVAALIGLTGGVAYGASKGGVLQMTKALALELRAHGVRVNSIHPGSTLTPMIETVLPTAQARAAAAAGIPWGRLGEPDEIARGALFLASQESASMTGAELVIDGGMVAR